jgi:hypothetical protein
MDSENRSCISPVQEREYYAELCALANSGALSRREVTALNQHVAICLACRELLQDFRAISSEGMANLAASQPAQPAMDEKSWSVERAKTQLFARIATQDAAMRPKLVQKASSPTFSSGRGSLFPSFSAAAFKLQFAAAAVLLMLGMVSAYKFGELVGENKGLRKAPFESQAPTPIPESPDTIHNAALERAAAVDQLRLQKLQEELERQSANLDSVKTQQKQLEQDRQRQTSLIAALNEEKTSTAAERDAIRRRLEETQASLTTTQQRLDTLREEGSRQLIHTANLQLRVDELSTRLKENDATLQREEALLAADREVRELMGARDLYIADVFDIDREGKMQKAFGRVFYTGGKSLIFYAFDLDRRPGTQDFKTYQAWGRRGPSDKRPLNMGALSLDNTANKRWSLHVDDPKLLSQIDAVFVTAETHAGVQKPTGKQLLFASLRTPPNHP